MKTQNKDTEYQEHLTCLQKPNILIPFQQNPPRNNVEKLRQASLVKICANIKSVKQMQNESKELTTDINQSYTQFSKLKNIHKTKSENQNIIFQNTKQTKINDNPQKLNNIFAKVSYNGNTGKNRILNQEISNKLNSKIQTMTKKTSESTTFCSKRKVEIKTSRVSSLMKQVNFNNKEGLNTLFTQTSNKKSLQILTNKDVFSQKRFLTKENCLPIPFSSIDKREFLKLMPTYTKCPCYLFNQSFFVCVTLAESVSKFEFKHYILKMTSLLNFNSLQMTEMQSNLGVDFNFKHFYDKNGKRLEKCANCKETCNCLFQELKLRFDRSYSDKFLLVISNVSVENIFMTQKLLPKINEKSNQFLKYFRFFENNNSGTEDAFKSIFRNADNDFSINPVKLVNKKRKKILNFQINLKQKNEELNKQKLENQKNQINEMPIIQKHSSVSSKIPFKITMELNSEQVFCHPSKQSNFLNPNLHQSVTGFGKHTSIFGVKNNDEQNNTEANIKKSKQILNDIFNFENWNSNHLEDFLKNLKTAKNHINFKTVSQSLNKSLVDDLTYFRQSETQKSKELYLNNFKNKVDNENFTKIEKLNDHYVKILSSFAHKNLFEIEKNPENVYLDPNLDPENCKIKSPPRINDFFRKNDG